MKNWKTTLSGILSIAAGVWMITNGKLEEGTTAIIAGVGLLLAKDYDTTGIGTGAMKL